MKKKTPTIMGQIRSWIRHKVANKIPLWRAWGRRQQQGWGSKNFSDLTVMGYKGNVYVVSGVDRISYNVASLPWKAYTEGDAGEPVELPNDDDLVQLWVYPHKLALLTGNLFRRHITNVLTLAGESHILKVRIPSLKNQKSDLHKRIIKANKARNKDEATEATTKLNELRKQEREGERPTSLIPLRPDWITYEGDGVIDRWKYCPGGNNAEAIYYDREDVVYIRHPDPEDYLKGVSPLQAAGLAINMLAFGNKWNLKILEHEGQLRYMLMVDDSMDASQIEEAQKKLSESQDDDTTFWISNASKIEKIGLAPQDMSWPEMDKTKAREIYIALKIPSTFGPDIESQNYAQLRAAVKQFFLDAVMTVARMVRDSFNTQMCATDFSQDIPRWLNWDDSKIPALIDDVTERWAAITAATDLTVDEKRQMRGVDPIEGDAGNSILVPGNMATLEEIAGSSGDEPEE